MKRWFPETQRRGLNPSNNIILTEFQFEGLLKLLQFRSNHITAITLIRIVPEKVLMIVLSRVELVKRSYLGHNWFLPRAALI
jgi:hypothetical protein